jgi:hypothetical protein
MIGGTEGTPVNPGTGVSTRSSAADVKVRGIPLLLINGALLLIVVAEFKFTPSNPP